MEIYKVEKRMIEYEINENEFLNFVKSKHPNDIEVQNIKTYKELISLFGCLDEFEVELNKFLIDTDSELITKIDYYFDKDDDAWRIYNE